ncbi:MAG: iron-containing alcohol dehydrogenase [Candidatus Thorarchaeota archaeon]
MALYGQVAYLPLLFQVESNACRHLPEYLEAKNLRFRKVLVVSGATYSADVARLILDTPATRHWEHATVASHSVREVERLRSLIYQDPVDLLVGVGGGKVLDVVKRVSLLQRVNHISIPTIISNDGLMSPISVLKNEQGRTESIGAQMPMGVIVDLDIVEKAPKRYLQAAAGDILSNLSATGDWKLASDAHNLPLNDVAFQLAVMSAHSVVHFADLSLDSRSFLRQVVFGQFTSGIAMALAGSSRPCSGSEHLLSHAIDYLGLSDSTLHGLQVGSISLFSLYLQDNLQPKHVHYARKLQLPLAFTAISPKIPEHLAHVFDVARTMRPGRYTVMDKWSTDELMQEYGRFKEFIRSIAGEIDQE